MLDLDRPSKKWKKGYQQTKTDDDDGSGLDDEFMSRVLAQHKAKKQAIKAGWEVESDDSTYMQDSNKEPPAVKQGKQDSGPRPRKGNDDPAGDDNDHDDHQGKKEAFNVWDGWIPLCKVPPFPPAERATWTGHDAYPASDKDDHKEQNMSHLISNVQTWLISFCEGPASLPAKQTTQTSQNDTAKQVPQPSLPTKQTIQVSQNNTAKPVGPPSSLATQTTQTSQSDTMKEVPPSLPTKQTTQTSRNDTAKSKPNRLRAPSEALSELTAVNDESEMSCSSRGSHSI